MAKYTIDIDVNLKSVEDLKSELVALEAEFSTLSIGSDGFIALGNQIKGVKSQLKDVELQFEGLDKEQRATALVDVFTGLVGAVGAVSSAFIAFGADSENIENAEKKLLGVIGVVNGLRDASNGLLALNKLTGNSFTTLGNTIAAGFKKGATAAQTFKSALIATGIGALIVAVGFLIENFDKLGLATESEKDKTDRLSKANDDLKQVLKNQSDAMKNLAAKQEEAAQATYNLNKSTENHVALINAQGNALGVVAQIEGLTSEQESNRVSLKKEKIALGQSEIENLNALGIEQKKFNESLETDELKKLENQRLHLEEEKRIELERLQLKINGAAQGTQARLDAENEYAIKTQEIDNALTTNKKAIADEEIKIEKAKADQKKAIQDAEFALASGAVNFLKEIGGKSKAIQKAAIIAENAIGIGKMIIANNAANIGALATPQAIASSGVSAIPVIAMNNITTALGVATTIAATAKALSAVGGGAAGSAGSVGGGMSGASVPKFNVVGASSTNQLAQTIGSQQQQPIKAYVVANDVTTQQGLDRNIVQSASIG